MIENNNLVLEKKEPEINPMEKVQEIIQNVFNWFSGLADFIPVETKIMMCIAVCKLLYNGLDSAFKFDDKTDDFILNQVIPFSIQALFDQKEANEK